MINNNNSLFILHHLKQNFKSIFIDYFSCSKLVRVFFIIQLEVTDEFFRFPKNTKIISQELNSLKKINNQAKAGILQKHYT